MPDGDIRGWQIVRWTQLHASVTLLILSFAITGLLALRTTPFAPSESCCDHLFYRSMAYNLARETRPDLNARPVAFDIQRLYDDPYHGQYLNEENHFNRQPPYAYRIVTPLTARLLAYPLGDNINRAFYAVTFAALVLANFWTARCVQLLSGRLLPAIVAVATFAAMPRLTRYHLYNYMLVDPLAYALMAASIYCMLRRNDRWFFALALAGVFNKETHLFVLAAYAIQQLFERRLTRRSVAAYAGIVGAYLVFRLALPIPNNTYDLRTIYLGLPRAKTVAQVALLVFGVLAPCVASRIWAVRFPLYLLPLAIGAFLPSLFAGNTDRSYVMAFPVVFLSVLGIRVRGWWAQVLAVSPGLIYIAVELIKPRVDVAGRWWDITAMLAFVIIDGLLLIRWRSEIELPSGYRAYKTWPVSIDGHTTDRMA